MIPENTPLSTAGPASQKGIPRAEIADHGFQDQSKNAADPPINLFLMVNTFETGGSERQFTILAKNLGPQFQVHVGCVNPRGPLAHNFVDALRFPIGGSLFGWQSMRTRFHLGRYLRQKRVQVTHSFDFYTNLVMVPAAKLAGVPVVIGSHRQLGDLMTASQFRAQAAVFRLCDAVVCNSQAAADRLVAAGVSARKIEVIGNALPAAAFAATEPALPKQSGVVRVGMVARMNARYKNHSSFLRIAARVRQQLPQTEFVLVGDGPLRQELLAEASHLGLGSSTLFLGDRHDMPAVLASLDVAVLTSDSESLSNVILEAMAAGLPVAAYDVGGNSELLNHGRGVLIPAGDEGAFADAVVNILSDSDRRSQLSNSARQFAQNNFSLEQVRGRYIDLYVRLLNTKQRSKSAA
jgi:glycosyltransferase involved in cell wall biosynthesis